MCVATALATLGRKMRRVVRASMNIELGYSTVVVFAHAGVKIKVGVSHNGSVYAWGAYGPSSILGIPTLIFTDSRGDCR